MSALHAKRVRREILTILYDHYMADPMAMLTPADLLAKGTLCRDDLAANVHYLRDRGLAELMLGFNPILFDAARITADGIDLVENRFEFNLRFPEALGEAEQATASIPVLMERLVAEADCAAIDGERRRCLLRDVQYLRDELARPVERWRDEVVPAVLDWMAAAVAEVEDALPSLGKLRAALGAARTGRQTRRQVRRPRTKEDEAQ